MSVVRYEKEIPQFYEISQPLLVKDLSIAFSPLLNLEGIGVFENLTNLQIHYCRKLEDISAISNCKNLELLNIYSVPNVKKMFEYSQLKKLRQLSLNNVSKIESIAGIEFLPGLQELGLSRVKIIDGNYEPIIKCSTLKKVFWFGGPFKKPALQTIKKERPDMLIGGNAVVNRA